ncbi:reverse transcriptase domain-containing protein, partial [Tanacetum coccineum]
MRTRSQSRNSNRQQQQVPQTFVEPFDLEEPIDNPAPPVVTMADNRTMAQLLEAPTEGYEDAIVVPEITADNFELKHGLLTLVQNKQFFGHDKEDPHAHIRYFNKITSTMKFPNVPTALTTDVAKLKDMMKTLILDKQKSQAPATVKAVEEKCVTCGGAHSYGNRPATDGNVYRDHIQEYVSQAAAANFNQGNTSYRAPIANQIRPPGFPPVQQNQGNNQNCYNQNQGNNYNQGPIHYPPVNQGQIYRPQVNQLPAYQAPAYQALTPQTQGVSKTDFESYVKANVAVMQNMQSQMSNITDLLTKIANSNAASTSGSGSLPSNTIANPKGELKAITTRSGASYDGPQVPPPTSSLPKVVENEPKVTKDMVPPTNNGSTKDVQPSVVQVQPHVPNSEPVVAPPWPVHGAAINLMPLSVWKKLSLPELTHTCMTLKLADYSITQPIGIIEDVYLKVRKFKFPANFVVVDFDADPRVPLILGRSFLKTGCALIDVYEGELTLRVGKEAVTFNLDQTLRYSSNYDDMTANRIDVIEMACEEYSQEVLDFSDVIASGNPTPYYDLIVSTSSPTLTPFEDSDFLLEEVDAFLALEDDPTSPEVDDSYYNPEGDILLLKSFLNDDPSLPPPTQGNYLPEIRKQLKVYEAKTHKSSIDEPPEVKLKDLPPNLEYAFLEGNDKLPVIIAKDLSVEEKATLIKVLKSHKRAIAWKLSDI